MLTLVAFGHASLTFPPLLSLVHDHALNIAPPTEHLKRAAHLWFKTFIDASINYMGDHEQTEKEYSLQGKNPKYMPKKYKYFFEKKINNFSLWKLDLPCSG